VPSAGKAEGSRRSTPAPSLDHLHWQADMSKRFGGKGGGGKAGV
jgi:hypothetical protein